MVILNTPDTVSEVAAHVVPCEKNYTYYLMSRYCLALQVHHVHVRTSLDVGTRLYGSFLNSDSNPLVLTLDPSIVILMLL